MLLEICEQMRWILCCAPLACTSRIALLNPKKVIVVLIFSSMKQEERLEALEADYNSTSRKTLWYDAKFPMPLVLL